jgi:2-methylcitrate dehydratase PrpD
MDLTGKREPASGLEGKFSVFHAAAVALVDGNGGEAEFSDARVLAPEVVSTRRLVTAQVEPGFQRTQCEVVLRMRDGSERRAETTTPLGSLGNPMSDDALGQKFLGLTASVLGEEKASRLLSRAWDAALQPGLGWLGEA